MIGKIGAVTAALLVAVVLCGIASADPYVGGVPPTTAKEGVVSGDLWLDHSHPLVTNWTKNFTLPSHTDVQWAHLYVAVYCGNMQNNYPGRANITFDGVQLGGTPDGLSSEEFNVSYSYPGAGGTGPAWVNDHCVRVTSDYLMWYNVTNLVNPGSDVWVKTWPEIGSSFDGRIKAVTLVVAYNDGDSDTIYYWVNQGHDVDTDYYSGDYIGETNFTADLPFGSSIQNANLTVVHMASSDGTYTFNGVGIPTDPDSTTTPSGENWQGSYSGYNIWSASNLFNSNSNNALTYNGTGEFYKITLAFLSVDALCSGTCGDVDGQNGVTIGDGIQVAMSAIYGTEDYPLANPGAADVDCANGITIGDGIQIAMSAIYGTGDYPLECCDL